MLHITQQQLESYLWGAATLLRGTIDAGDYKQFIFPLLFYKRLCDVFDEETRERYIPYVIEPSGGVDRATLAFLVSRILLRDWVQGRFERQLRAVNEGFRRDGSFYLFSLRLVPVFPFFAINLLMGLTPIRTWTYYWVSQVGMLPGTAVRQPASSNSRIRSSTVGLCPSRGSIRMIRSVWEKASDSPPPACPSCSPATLIYKSLDKPLRG